MKLSAIQLIIGVLLVSCDAGNNGGQHHEKIVVSHFTSIPPVIEGCACYYGSSLEHYNRNEFVFVSDTDSNAYISIDEEMIKLRLASTTIQPGTFGNHDHISQYTAPGIKIRIDIKYRKPAGEESWWNTGRITVDLNETRKVIEVTGQCGC